MQPTVANIVDSVGLFRGGLVAFTVVFVLDLVIAWALYLFFRTVCRDLSYGTVFLLIVAVPSVVGELAFTIWLLWRGGKAQEALA